MVWDVVVHMRGADAQGMPVWQVMQAHMSRNRVDSWARNKGRRDPNVKCVDVKGNGVSQAFWPASPDYRDGSRGDSM